MMKDQIYLDEIAPLIARLAYPDEESRKAENRVRQRIRDAIDRGRLTRTLLRGDRQSFDRETFLAWATEADRWPVLAEHFGIPIGGGQVADNYAPRLTLSSALHVTPERPANDQALWDEYVNLFNRIRQLERSNSDLQRELDTARESLGACERRLKYGKRT